MGQANSEKTFYMIMGGLLLALVVAGFGLTAIVSGRDPMLFPLLFHVHAVVYLLWFGLFILQASLIAKGNRSLHMTLGKFSILIVLTMLVTGWLMAAGSYARGVSPIPNISIQQFMAFPLFDLLGLIVFYGLALAKRYDAAFHKRAMLLSLIAIIDPAAARLGFVVGFPPFPLLASLVFIGAIIWFDRKDLGRVHAITWFGLAWVLLRLGFVFGIASSETWARIANGLFA